ncbi:predicted protein [Naegleria gruberi]|uniref:Predicted protein n=1 Tax=Naegleria gruberi TaxID=5762 RepID=D2VHQ5_NAEGR|nr:uncharacterized protein NAEGRDRAFT_68409 [Naegleria gruberi]EFC43635.1 predicted protein [Naegleria gruberi]|eukprot:XP_002676379.1 predicted protein [Naegleria gruberi strain NEG-M]
MKLDVAIDQVVSKSCLAGLKGVQCPENIGKKRFTPSSTLDLLFAGMGYDSYAHTVKPQILNSNTVNVLSSPSVNSISVTMTDARQFYSQVYPISGQQSTFYNGLYTHNGGADEIFTKFFEGKLNVLNAQQQYTTHQTSVTNAMDITSGFSRIVEILPNEMNQEMYEKIIEFFGDSVMTLVNFGGVVDSTVSVRGCYSDPNMENYVKTQLSGIIQGYDADVPVGWVKYHKISELDIAGGNPEIDNIPRRVETFHLNPVPIRFDTIPIWQVFPEGPKRNNMKAVYDSYVQAQGSMVENKINRIQQLKLQELQKPQPFVAYARRKSNNFIYGIAEGLMAIGQPIDISALSYKFFTNQLAVLNGKTTVRLIRHNENVFHMEAIQSCPNMGAYAAKTPTLISNVVGNSCAFIRLENAPVGGGFKNMVERVNYDEANELFVCSGCHAYILNWTDLRCDCPAIN